MTKNTNWHGFSLIELMAVVAIIGTLAAILIARAPEHIENAGFKTCFHNRSIINSAIERYALSEGDFPSSISDLDDPAYLQGAALTCPITGDSYTIDSTTNRVDGHTATTNPGDH